MADEATLAGVVQAAGSPVHPQPLAPGQLPPPLHYTLAMREWLENTVALVVTTRPSLCLPDFSTPNPPMDADILGDEIFIQHISETFVIPAARLRYSSRLHDVKMILRDKMKLKNIVPKLHPSSNCFTCKHEVHQAEAKVISLKRTYVHNRKTRCGLCACVSRLCCWPRCMILVKFLEFETRIV